MFGRRWRQRMTDRDCGSAEAQRVAGTGRANRQGECGGGAEIATLDVMKIQVADAGDLAALGYRLGRKMLFADRLARQAAGLGLLLVAWVGSIPVGSVYLWMEPAFEPEVRKRLPDIPLLVNLEVRTDLRNRGIGTALVGAVERRSAEYGHGSLALGVEVSNVGAARLYERLGYQDWGYPPIACYSEKPPPNGRNECGGEICYILVKSLG